MCGVLIAAAVCGAQALAQAMHPGVDMGDRAPLREKTQVLPSPGAASVEATEAMAAEVRGGPKAG